MEHFHGSVAAGAIEGALVGDRAGLQQVAGGAAAVVVTIAEDGLGVGALAHEDQQHVDHVDLAPCLGVPERAVVAGVGDLVRAGLRAAGRQALQGAQLRAHQVDHDLQAAVEVGLLFEAPALQAAQERAQAVAADEVRDLLHDVLSSRHKVEGRDSVPGLLQNTLAGREDCGHDGSSQSRNLGNDGTGQSRQRLSEARDDLGQVLDDVVRRRCEGVGQLISIAGEARDRAHVVVGRHGDVIGQGLQRGALLRSQLHGVDPIVIAALPQHLDDLAVAGRGLQDAVAGADAVEVGQEAADGFRRRGVEVVGLALAASVGGAHCGVHLLPPQMK